MSFFIVYGEILFHLLIAIVYREVCKYIMYIICTIYPTHIVLKLYLLSCL